MYLGNGEATFLKLVYGLAFPSYFQYFCILHVLMFPVSLQVHKLEPDVWKNVEVVQIDIADRTQVLSKVGMFCGIFVT